VRVYQLRPHQKGIVEIRFNIINAVPGGTPANTTYPLHVAMSSKSKWSQRMSFAKMASTDGLESQLMNWRLSLC
jgi:hypothetical protein